MRIAFLGDVDPADARAVLAHLQGELWTRAKALERARAAALSQATGDPSRGLPVLALMLARRIRRLAAELAFLDDLRSSYEEWLASRPPVEPKPVAAPQIPALPLAATSAKIHSRSSGHGVSARGARGRARASRGVGPGAALPRRARGQSPLADHN